MVGYNAESQQSWLSKLGLGSVYSSVIILLGNIVLLILAYVFRIYLKARQAQSPFDRAIQQLNQSLADDLKKQPAETFHHWMQRLSQQTQVENQTAFIQAIQIFEKNLYSGISTTEQEVKKFKDLLKTCADVLKTK